MIVVAIIGILAAVALPAYNDYIERSKLTTGIAGMQTYKNAITDCWMNIGSFATCIPGNGTAENLYRIPDADLANTDGATIAGVDDMTTTAGVIAITTTGTSRAGAQMTITFTATTILNATQLRWNMTGTGCQDNAGTQGDPRTINCRASDN